MLGWNKKILEKIKEIEKMEINLKDLALALLLGLVLQILLGDLIVTAPFLYFIIIILFPLGFYFWRNKHAWDDTAGNSFIYGFLLSAISWILISIKPLAGLFASTYAGSANILLLLFYISKEIGILVTKKFLFIPTTCILTGIVAMILGCVAKYLIETIRQDDKQTKKPG